MVDLLFKAQKYMNAKDILASKGITKRLRKEKETEDHSGRKKEGKLAHNLPKDSKGCFPNFTLLVMPSSKILMQVKNDPALRWPKPMRSHLKRRNKGKYCRFHKDHGHDMDDGHDLKDQIKNLIQ